MTGHLSTTDEPRGARPPGGRCYAIGWHFISAKYFRVIKRLRRCKSTRPRGRTGTARRRYAPWFRAGVHAA